MNAIEAGLYSKLSGTAAIITELANGTAIYNQLVPQDETLPYIVYNFAGGGLENINPSDLHNVVYAVKAVAGESKAAGTLQGLIKTALHGAALTVSGYTNLYTAAETEINMVEMGASGKPIFHRGHYYRIRVDA
jgi:hypothetical protein